MNDGIDEFKIVFTGPMGAGKTTALAAISDVEPVRTEVANTDRLGHEKAFTTVGIDFGRIELDGGQIVRLYGTPGQARFRLMWEITGRGANGIVVLVDASQPGALMQMGQFVDAFRTIAPAAAMVVGVGRTTEPGALASEDFAARLEDRGIAVPVLSVDVRRRADVLLLLQTLLCLVEAEVGAETSA